MAKKKALIHQPPSHLAEERAVLGAIMLDKEALIKAADVLLPEDFYDPVHAIVYDACLKLFQSSNPVDPGSVKLFLSKNGLLGKLPDSEFLEGLVSYATLTTNVDYYSKMIKEASLRRRIISLSSDLVGAGIDQSRKLEDIIDDIERKIFDIAKGSNLANCVHIKDLLVNISERFEGVENDPESFRGISTGFVGLNNIIGGLHKGDLVVIAARPSVGKTAFMLEIVRSIAVDLKKKVLIFSLEMPKEQVADRLLSLQSGVSLVDIRMGNLEGDNWARCKEAMERLYDSEIFIDDTPGLHISEIRTKSRKWHLEMGIEAIFVDYLQLLQGRAKDNRVQEVSEISQGLKNIARELKIPVIALSQLNRSVESRNDRRPQLSDLRESGSIEQDADIVIFLHREAYYNRDLDEYEKEKAEAVVAKNRNGATGIVNLRFIDVCAKFVDSSS